MTLLCRSCGTGVPPVFRSRRLALPDDRHLPREGRAKLPLSRGSRLPDDRPHTFQYVPHLFIEITFRLREKSLPVCAPTPGWDLAQR
jgi:hypothetical protein